MSTSMVRENITQQAHTINISAWPHVLLLSLFIPRLYHSVQSSMSEVLIVLMFLKQADFDSKTVTLRWRISEMRAKPTKKQPDISMLAAVVGEHDSLREPHWCAQWVTGRCHLQSKGLFALCQGEGDYICVIYIWHSLCWWKVCWII